MTTGVFAPAGPAVVRIAMLPAARAAPTKVDLGPDSDPERLASYLTGLATDPVLAEAILSASPSLADTIRRVEEGRPVPVAKLARAARAATRYLLRMTGRPSPFGLLAGVAPATLGGASVRLGGAHRKAARADAEWLAAVLRELRRSPSVRARARVLLNNLCTVRDDRLVLGYVRHPGGPHSAADPVRELSVAYTPVVRAVVEATRRPIAYPQLRGRLRAEFPAATEAQVDGLLEQLLEREILLAELESRPDEPDPLGYANRLLSGVDDPRVAALHRIERLLREYETAPVGDGAPAWRRVTAAMRELHDRPQPPVQVDLRADVDVRLPREIGDEVARAVSALWRLSPPPEQASPLPGYHAAFLDRYGTDRLVPLPELLDEHRGLGVPAGYRVPRGERAGAGAQPEPYQERRDELVAALALGALTDGSGEVVLDDELVERLADPSAEPPASMDACVQLFAGSVADLSAGHYRLALSSVAGSFAAGAMAGRFAALLGVGPVLGELHAPPVGTGPAGPLPVQLQFLPHRPRSGNVSRVPPLLPYTLAVGCDTAATGCTLTPADLAVGASRDRLYLVAPAQRREVTVLALHMLDLYREAPNVARFVVELASSGVHPWTSWRWGRAAVLPRLPRVRLGRTVLAPAQWRPDPKLCDATISWPEWRRVLGRWRERWSVPDVVRVGVLDQHLDLDLTAPLHQWLLRDELTGSVLTTVSEPPDGPRPAVGWIGGHANEVVVSLRRIQPRQPLPPRQTWRVAGPPRYPPGGEWLFAKVYAVAGAQDALLRRQVHELVTGLPSFVDRWFFARYRDPEPHLRLRFHGPAHLLNTELLAVLHRWADQALAGGVIRALALDGYEPEVDRYGGPDAMEAAERLFCADSIAVLAQLQLRTSGLHEVPAVLLAAMNHVELLAGLGDWDWPAWVAERFTPAPELFRPYRDRTAQLVDPTRDWSAVRALPGGPELLSCWRARRGAAGAYGRVLGVGTADVARFAGPAESLLHMHANRLLGTDHRAEARAYAILRNVVRAYLGRRQHRQSAR